MRTRAWRGVVALLLFVPIGVIDRITGPTLDVTVGYFILIVLATINLGLGGAVAAVILATAADIYDKARVLGGGNLPVWVFALNVVSRTAAFVVVAGLVHVLDSERGKVELLSQTDKLTALFNRRRLDEAVLEETLRAERYHHPLALVMLDVDHFKKYNDRNGHLKGDGVLRQTGKLLLRTKRATDLAFRYGGEEFCLLLPETDLDEAKGLAERLRIAIEKESFIGEHTQPGARLTASFGIAALAPGEDPKSLVLRADRALYAAKERGRNRVEISDGPAPRRSAP